MESTMKGCTMRIFLDKAINPDVKKIIYETRDAYLCRLNNDKPFSLKLKRLQPVIIKYIDSPFVIAYTLLSVKIIMPKPWPLCQ